MRRSPPYPVLHALLFALTCSCAAHRPWPMGSHPLEATPMDVRQTRVLHIPIQAEPEAVSAYLSDVARWKEWAPWVHAAAETSKGCWNLDTPEGRMELRFVRPGDPLSLDHWVRLANGQTAFNGMRVVGLGGRSELILVLFQAAGTPDEAFEADSRAVNADLERIKAALEGPAHP